MLEATILDQVRSIFQPLEARYTFHITCNPEHEQAGEMIDFLNDIASCSDKLSCQVTETDEPKLEFTLLKEGKETGIKFRAIPGGHEFSSLLLAVLNADGKGKNLPDEGIGRRIKALQGPGTGSFGIFKSFNSNRLLSNHSPYGSFSAYFSFTTSSAITFPLIVSTNNIFPG